MGATTIINREPVLHRESAAKVIENRRLLIQVEIDYMHYKIGR